MCYLQWTCVSEMALSLEAAGTSLAKKRRRNFLTIDQKLEICKLVNVGTSHNPFKNANRASAYALI